MTTLFAPLKLGQIELSNRLIMAPLTRSRSNDAGVPPDFAAKYSGFQVGATRLNGGAG